MVLETISLSLVFHFLLVKMQDIMYILSVFYMTAFYLLQGWKTPIDHLLVSCNKNKKKE